MSNTKNEETSIEPAARPGMVLPTDAGMADVAERLIDQARSEGIALTGAGGLLTSPVQQVPQASLESELTDHLGYEAHAIEGRRSGNSRNGFYPKTMKSEIGDIDLEIPRDRAGTFTPATVPVGQRRLDGLDAQVIPLYAKGLTTGDIAGHLFDSFDLSIDRSTISRITDQIVDDMTVWQPRTPDTIHPVLMVDGIRIKDPWRDRHPPHCLCGDGINMEGERDILGLCVGPSGGESAKFWLGVLSELKNRGIQDCLMLCCDGLKGLPDSARAVWPLVDVQLCVVHLVRNSLRFASKKHRGPITRQLREISTAPSIGAAEVSFEAFAQEWESVYPEPPPARAAARINDKNGRWIRRWPLGFGLVLSAVITGLLMQRVRGSSGRARGVRAVLS